MRCFKLLLISLIFTAQASANITVQGCNILQYSSSWDMFKQQFIAPDGRVVDNGNANISHSEGQGYGLLLADFFGDHQSFKKIWNWTESNLQRTDNALFYWKWQANQPHIPDRNNASDGDILIAWALLKADRSWPGNNYLQIAQKIIDELASNHIIKLDNEYALLPAKIGFQHNKSTVINPAYWVYPALDDFVQQGKIWAALSKSGRDILSKNQFGQYQLPSDWLEFNGADWLPAKQFPSRFSYSSYRIPLYLIWAGYQHPINGYYQQWLQQNNTAWVDINNNSMADHAPPTSAYAIATLVKMNQSEIKNRNTLPLPKLQDDYYSASLTLFTHIAFHERFCK